MLSALMMGGIGLVAVLVGLQGVIRARKVSKLTPNAAMSYPVRLPWLHNRKTDANTVFRIGQLYATAGCVLCVCGVGAWLMDTANDRVPACAEIASSLLSAPANNLPLTVKEDSNSKHACIHTITASQGRTWFQIESTPNANPIGEQFNSKVRDMERNGMATEPVSGGFRRAVVGTPGADTQTPITIVIEDSRGLHTIEVHPPALKHQTLATVLQNLDHRPTIVP